jgi:hypothetical protein
MDMEDESVAQMIADDYEAPSFARAGIITAGWFVPYLLLGVTFMALVLTGNVITGAGSKNPNRGLSGNYTVLSMAAAQGFKASGLKVSSAGRNLTDSSVASLPPAFADRLSQLAPELQRALGYQAPASPVPVPSPEPVVGRRR